jgi:hypothetical protein
MSDDITIEMHEQVWGFVDGAGVGVNPTLVACYDDVVTDLLEKGLDAEAVSSHIVLAIRRQWASLQAGMEAFEVFCECLNFAAQLNDAVPDPMESLAHVVKTKAGLAVFYDELAKMAPYAGVDGLDSEVTGQERQEALAERDDILAKIAAAQSEDSSSE